MTTPIPANDEGSVTVEAALALSALMVIFIAMIGGMTSLGAYLSAIDSAGAAARAHAIGVPYQPAKGEVNIVEHGGLATATATVPAVIGTVSATAIFPMEH